ncbi:DUF3829 domain-containing protein, partial [Escherichia coli]|uniref:DUF3829 domain-containing protein n=1 Tax=Escherichia coli TaxID=562 RepID=UPI00208DD92C
DGNGSHASTLKSPSYTKSVSWQHYRDKEQLQDANSSWMVEDSFPRALREYNEMVDDYNSLR